MIGEGNYSLRTPGGHDWLSQSGRQGEQLMPSDMALYRLVGNESNAPV